MTLHHKIKVDEPLERFVSTPLKLRVWRVNGGLASHTNSSSIITTKDGGVGAGAPRP